MSVYSPQDYFRDHEELAVVHIDRQGSIRLHAHHFHELVLVLGGQGEHNLIDHSYPIHAGDVFVLPPGLSHGYAKADNLELVNILYRKERLQMPLADMGDLPGYYVLFELEPGLRSQQVSPARFNLGISGLHKLRPLISSLKEELETKQPGYRSLALACFYRLCGELARAYTQEQSGAPSPSLLQISELMSRLDRDYASTITLADMTRWTNMSVSTLHRHFRKCFNLSPIDYLLRLRLSKAADLLQKTLLDVSQIALRTGFQDSNYFSRQFRRVYSLSPRDYRKGKGSASV